MYQFFLICATIGGTILILRLALSLLGLGFDSLDGAVGDFGDAEADADFGDDAAADPADGGQGNHADLGRIFTFQAIVSFLAFFGIGGLAALEAGEASGGRGAHRHGDRLRRRLAAGVRPPGAPQAQHRRHGADPRAVGLEGKVYLRIPANGGGEGKITLPIQGRTIEVLARTPGPGLRAGEPVVVSRVIDEQIVEVVTPQSHVVKPAAFAE